MKKLLLLLVTLAASAMVTGCVVTSVYPFYHQKDLAFESTLVGQWINPEQATEHWVFEQEGTNAYRVTFSSGTNRVLLDGHLFRISGQLFLDLFNRHESDDMQPPPIPSHVLLRVSQLSPTLRFSELNYDWLKQVLASNPNALRHHAVLSEEKPQDRRIVLTADTAELQKFLEHHLKTEEAWTHSFELKRNAAPLGTAPQKTR